jgi:hypothetical protein
MLRKCSLAVAIALVSISSYAASSTAPGKVRVVHGVFYAETGQKIEFRVAEGRSLTLTNKEKNLSYRLIPEILGEDRVQLRIVEAASNAVSREVESFDLSMGDKEQAGVVVPFSLSLKGISVEDAVTPKVPTKNRIAERVVASNCCITCGGWQVCCTPSAGYCCDLSSSCGNSCSACNAS